MSSSVEPQPDPMSLPLRRRLSEFALRVATVAIVGFGSLQLGLDSWSFVLVYGLQLGLALMLLAPWLYALDEVVQPTAAAVAKILLILALVWLVLVVLPLLWSFGRLQEASLLEIVLALPDQIRALLPLVGLLLLADLAYLVARTLDRRPHTSPASTKAQPIPAHLTERLLHRALVHALFVMIGPIMLQGLVSGGWNDTLAIVVVYVGLEFYLMLRFLWDTRSRR